MSNFTDDFTDNIVDRIKKASMAIRKEMEASWSI